MNKFRYNFYTYIILILSIISYISIIIFSQYIFQTYNTYQNYDKISNYSKEFYINCDKDDIQLSQITNNLECSNCIIMSSGAYDSYLIWYENNFFNFVNHENELDQDTLLIMGKEINLNSNSNNIIFINQDNFKYNYSQFIPNNSTYVLSDVKDSKLIIDGNNKKYINKATNELKQQLSKFNVTIEEIPSISIKEFFYIQKTLICIFVSFIILSLLFFTILIFYWCLNKSKDSIVLYTIGISKNKIIIDVMKSFFILNFISFCIAYITLIIFNIIQVKILDLLIFIFFSFVLNLISLIIFKILENKYLASIGKG